jgi:hypothetical protein
MKFDTIFAIASGQSDPLILPFLSADIECKELVLLVTKQIEKAGTANNISDTLKPRGIHVTCIALPDPTWDAMQQTLENELHKHPHKKVAFNANGGTKPMTLAAYEYCYNNDIPVFYVDGNRLDWLYDNNDKTLIPIKIEHSLSIDSYLLSHGYEISEKESPLNSAPLKEMVARWVTNPETHLVSALNNIAARGNKNQLRIELKDYEQGYDKPVYELIEDLENNSLLNIEDNAVKFVSEDARFFANGGWYELHLLKLLESINARYFDGKGKVLSGFTLRPIKTKKTVDTKLKNEIDVAYILNNRLYLFECKTANLSKKSGRAEEAVYKLGAVLKDIGGINAKGFIVSYHKIQQHDKDRAGLFGINLIEHQTNQQEMINRLCNGIRQVDSRL